MKHAQAEASDELNGVQAAPLAREMGFAPHFPPCNELRVHGSLVGAGRQPVPPVSFPRKREPTECLGWTPASAGVTTNPVGFVGLRAGWRAHHELASTSAHGLLMMQERSPNGLADSAAPVPRSAEQYMMLRIVERSQPCLTFLGSSAFTSVVEQV